MTKKNKKTLTPIADPVERMAMYKKLKKEVEKMANDIRRYHGLNVCTITNRPDGSGTDVWPSRAGAKAAFDHLTMVEEMERGMMEKRKEKEAESVSGQAAAASTSVGKVVKKETQLNADETMEG